MRSEVAVPDNPERKCRYCGAPLTEANWMPSLMKTDNRMCKQCSTTRHRMYVSKHREEVNSWHRGYVRSKKHGITADDWSSRLKSQDGKCLLCGLPLGDSPVVDRDRQTNRVRGLTHRACSMILEGAGDSPAMLQRAIDYLKRNDSMAKICGRCGTPAASQKRFCGNCGAPLPGAMS